MRTQKTLMARMIKMTRAMTMMTMMSALKVLEIAVDELILKKLSMTVIMTLRTKVSTTASVVTNLSRMDMQMLVIKMMTLSNKLANLKR